MSEPKETEPGEPAESESESESEQRPEAIKDRNARVRAEAAEKRRARRTREQAASAPRRNLDASEMMDDALARSSHAAWTFLRAHFNKVQWAIMAGLAAWIAWEVYSWRHTQQAVKATDALFKALAAEHGKVAGDEAGGDEDRGGATDTRPSFPTDSARLNAAKKEYQLASGVAGPAARVLADLGAAGVAYDLGEYKDAQAAFEKVKQQPAFSSDGEIKGRTLEGLGMALEAQKNEEGALKVFKELANLDTANFSALGYYHQARLLKGQGKNEEALKLLAKAGEKLVLLKDTPAAIKYLRLSVMELYESLDQTKARELQQKLMPADVVKQLQELGRKPGAMMPGGALPMPLPAPPEMPEAPAPAPEMPEAPTPGPGPLRDLPAPIQDAPAPAPSGSP